MPTAWQSKYPKNTKPAYDELLAFLAEPVRQLFLRFNDEMNSAFQVYNKWHRYENASGWVYGYCRNYRCELLSVSIGDDCFRVLGVDVRDEESLHLAMKKAKEAYDKGYEERYSRLVAAKKEGQKQRSKIRAAHEKQQMEAIMQTLDPDKLNRFRWSPKVSRAKLVRLYKGEAAGLLDTELLEEIGHGFYSRCKQAEDTRALLDRGKLICHHCGEVLSAADYTSAIQCACGYAYTYREYRRSCNAASMPGGRAAPIFHAFAEQWPMCKSTEQKMLLIDRLIHECHVTVMSGERGRSVCMNLIEGTTAQLRDTLEALAGHI